MLLFFLFLSARMGGERMFCSRTLLMQQFICCVVITQVNLTIGMAEGKSSVNYKVSMKVLIGF